MSWNLQLFSEADCRWLNDHQWLAGVELYREIDSTNQRALACAPSMSLPHLIVAETQTAGRGRGANRWHSRDGCLMFSLRLDSSSMRLPRHQLGILSLAAGLAMREALSSFVPPHQVKLKWPNDVFLADRKVCGILLEMADTASAPAVVIGVGVNVHNSLADAPADVQQKAATLADHVSPPPTLRDVLETVLDSMELEMQRVADGALDLVSRWQDCCFLHNKYVEIRQVTETIQGRCQGINGNGALLVSTDSGVREVSSGEVVSIQ